MPVVNKSFVFDFESNLRVIAVDEYARMLKNMVADRFVKTVTSKSKKEVIGFLLDTATIEDQGLGGNVAYDDMSMVNYEVKNLDAGKGLLIRKQAFEDLDGNGVQVGTKWVRNISAQAAYWKQKKAMQLIKDAATTTSVIGYDRKDFFSKGVTVGAAVTDAHPFDPNAPGKGGFANWFTGAASGAYPGAVPIDVANASTVEDAVNNLTTALAYIAGSIKMPSGVDPRFLKATALLHPPALTARAQQITKAKFIAQDSAGGGGGTGDIEAMIRNYGFGEPIEAPELSLANGGSDTDYYLICEEIAAGDQLGAIIHQVREAFAIQFYSGSGSADGIDAQLQRAQELEWLCHGRYAVAPGHPYLIFKCSAT